MTSQTRTVLKALFEDGDTPAGSSFADWIDSMVAIADSTAQAMTSDLIVPTLNATTEVSAPLIKTTEVSASTGSFVVVNTDTVSAQRITASAATFLSTVTAGELVVTGTAAVGDGDTLGKVVLNQSFTVTDTVSANSTAAVLPDGSDVLDVRFFVNTAFATAAADVKVRIGTSANETLFGELDLDVNIAGGMHVLTNAALNSAGTTWQGLTGAGAKVMVQVTAVSGAVASGASGELFITYVQ
mgnify:CR=1 FL=1